MRTEEQSQKKKDIKKENQMGNSMKNLLGQSISILTRCALIAVCLSALQSVAAQERSYVNPSSPGGSGSPFSGAVLTDDTLYISGMLGLENGEVPAEPAEEARNVLDSIKGTLEEAGMTMDDLVYVQIFAPTSAITPVLTKCIGRILHRSFPPGPLSVPARCCSMPDLKFRRSR